MRFFKSTALGISFVSILFNLSLTLVKLVVGLIGNSYALVSDAIHSIADVMSSAVVAVGIKMSCKPADSEHPYGHERFESVTAIMVAIILLITGLALGYSSISTIATRDYGSIEPPTTLALIMAVIPIVAKELMFRFEEYMSKRLNSDALHADALHHRADEWVSLGVLAGVAGGHFGYAIIDTLVGFIVSLLIIKAAVEIFYTGICNMVDKAIPDEYREALSFFVESKLSSDMKYEISTRVFGSSYLADITLFVSADHKAGNYFEFVDYLNDEILCNFKKIKCCNIILKPL